MQPIAQRFTFVHQNYSTMSDQKKNQNRQTLNEKGGEWSLDTIAWT